MLAAKAVGFAEVEKLLGQALPKIAKKALRRGVAKGAQLLAKRAKSRVQRGHGGVPGLLRKSIGNRVKTYRSGQVVGVVGPRKGFLHILKGGQRVDPAKYAHIEEKGRKAFMVRRKRVLSNRQQVFGKKVSAYQGRPFLKPTLDQDGDAAQSAMAQMIGETIEKEAARQ